MLSNIVAFFVEIIVLPTRPLSKRTVSDFARLPSPGKLTNDLTVRMKSPSVENQLARSEVREIL